MNPYCDNKIAISFTHNPVQHERTKQVEADQYFIKDHLKINNICTPFVMKKYQLADKLTKGLSGPPYSCIVSKLGM